MKNNFPRRTLAFVSRSPLETQKIGWRLGKNLKVGDVILLVGNLGGGKTTFAQGVLKGLGVKEGVVSPTFILAQSFFGGRGGRRFPIHHLDFYRLNKKEILAMGVQDYLTGSGEIDKGAVLIEWAEKLKDIWPAERLTVKFSIGKNPETRKICLVARGNRLGQLLKRLEEK